MTNVGPIFQLLVNNWRRTEAFHLWNVDIGSRPILWWAFTIPHVFAWTVIYGGSLMMDLPELLGCKQVYYDVNDLAPPLSYKTIELSEFYSRLRHPSFTGFLIIFWCTNCMRWVAKLSYNQRSSINKARYFTAWTVCFWPLF